MKNSESTPPPPPKPLVLVESPYRHGDRERNLRYLAWCEHDAFQRGENPIASHGNCPAYLPEVDTGREAGFAWRAGMQKVCSYIAYYTDLGISEGMRLASEQDQLAGILTYYRELDSTDMWAFAKGEYPPGSMRRIPNPL